MPTPNVEDTFTWQYIGANGQTVGNEMIEIFRGPAMPLSSIMNALVYVMAVNAPFTSGKSGQMVGTFIRDGVNISQDGATEITLLTGSLGCVLKFAVDVLAQVMTVTAKGVNNTVINYRAMGYFRTMKVAP